MVGSGRMPGGRSKEFVGMMALHDALRTLCLNSDWTYSVFWTIRPRPRVRGGNACKLGDENGSLMLMWEDGFCGGDMDEEDPVRKAFSKMSIQLYNYGEGLMGKVASDKCHKWVFKEPTATDCEPNASNSWQSSFDALPPEWTDQFESGILTIAVIQAGHGLLQLGSCKIIPEDLHFVLRMRHTFESLRHQSGYYLSQLFSSTRDCPSSSTPLGASASEVYLPSPHINWVQRPLPSMLSSPGLQHPGRLGFPQPKDETRMFLQSHSSKNRMEEMMSEPDNNIKCPNGTSFFNTITGRSGDGKPLFDHDGMAKKLDQIHMSPMHDNGEPNPNEFISLESQPDSESKAGKKVKRRSTLQARMRSSPSSADQQQPQNSADYRNSKTGMYPATDMEDFME